MISFFTPIISNQHVEESLSSLRWCDNFFTPIFWSTKSIQIISYNETYNITVVDMVDGESEGFISTAIKVILLFTIVIPLIALIGKLIYRSCNNFTLKEFSNSSTQNGESKTDSGTNSSTTSTETDTAPNRTGAGGIGLAYTTANQVILSFTNHVQDPDYDFG